MKALFFVLMAGCATADSATSNTSSCTADSDCVAKSNYCGGCSCTALHVGESLPKCKSAPVQCLIDPCRAKVARCDGGACTVAPKQN